MFNYEVEAEAQNHLIYSNGYLRIIQLPLLQRTASSQQCPGGRDWTLYTAGVEDSKLRMH